MTEPEPVKAPPLVGYASRNGRQARAEQHKGAALHAVGQEGH